MAPEYVDRGEQHGLVPLPYVIGNPQRGGRQFRADYSLPTNNASVVQPQHGARADATTGFESGLRKNVAAAAEPGSVGENEVDVYGFGNEQGFRSLGEFVRGIYHHFGERQENENFWGHRRRLAESWYRGETGIVPLDHAIRTAERLGWTHHITRLMVVGNLMTLAEIAPREAYRWFMEMYVDSSDWVMGPNVYGMALFSDGGIFATKPYICGSNYLLKMSDFGRGDWCDVVDGLYWRFIDRHRDYFGGNPRLAMMVRMLDKLKPDRREKIFAAAEGFLARHTVVG